MTNKTVLIREAIDERFGACVVLPFGSQSILAAEFGVSRQLVGQITTRAGKRGTRTAPPPPRRFCASCNEELPKRSQVTLCRECRWINIACENCGTLVRRLASRLVGQIGQTHIIKGKLATYTGRVFCDRRCYGMWAGQLNLKPIKHGTRHAYVSRGCRCEECHEAYRARNRQAYLLQKERTGA